MTKIEVKLLNSEEIALTVPIDFEVVEDSLEDSLLLKKAIAVPLDEDTTAMIPASSIVYVKIYREKNESN